MMRIGEVILGSLIAAVFTRNFVIAAVIGVLLYVAWEQGTTYGGTAEYDDDDEEEDIDTYYAVYTDGDDDTDTTTDMEREDTKWQMSRGSRTMSARWTSG